MTKNCQHFTEPMKISLKFGQVTEFLLICVYIHIFFETWLPKLSASPIAHSLLHLPTAFLPQTCPTIPHSSCQAQQEPPVTGWALPAWHPGCEAAATLKCTAMKNCTMQRSIKAMRVLKKPKRTDRKGWDTW